MNTGRTWSGSRGGTKRGLANGKALERMAVITEAVVVATVEPSMGEEAGDTEHEESLGAPVHVHVIV
jgi:hypothetical protein